MFAVNLPVAWAVAHPALLTLKSQVSVLIIVVIWSHSPAGLVFVPNFTEFQNGLGLSPSLAQLLLSLLLSVRYRGMLTCLLYIFYCLDVYAGLVPKPGGYFRAILLEYGSLSASPRLAGLFCLVRANNQLASVFSSADLPTVVTLSTLPPSI